MKLGISDVESIQASESSERPAIPPAKVSPKKSSPKKVHKKEASPKKESLQKKEESPKKDDTKEQAISEVKKLREKLSTELLAVLEFEQKQEDERDKKLIEQKTDEDKQKLEKLFGIERARASNRIVSMSKYFYNKQTRRDSEEENEGAWNQNGGCKVMQNYKLRNNTFFEVVFTDVELDLY